MYNQLTYLELVNGKTFDCSVIHLMQTTLILSNCITWSSQFDVVETCCIAFNVSCHHTKKSSKFECSYQRTGQKTADRCVKRPNKPQDNWTRICYLYSYFQMIHFQSSLLYARQYGKGDLMHDDDMGQNTDQWLCHVAKLSTAFATQSLTLQLTHWCERKQTYPY